MEKVDMVPQIVVEKDRIADPAPLGLAGFALTTFVLSAHNAGWAQDITWIGLAFFYGGLGQLLAGQWEFKKNNTFGATAFSTYGCFWMSLALFVVLLLTGVIPKDFDVANALGWFLSGFFIFTFYMTICALQATKAVFTVFFLLTITFLCLFIGNFSYEPAGLKPSWTVAGGYFGIFTAAAAFYASFANCFNAMAGREIVFVGSPLLSFSHYDA